MLLLNSDTELTENSIKISYDNYKLLKRPGFMGVKTLYADRTIQETCSLFPTIKNSMFELFSINKIFGLSKLISFSLYPVG